MRARVISGAILLTLATTSVVGGGCAQNAILELTLDLPAQPTGAPLLVQVQARTAERVDFDESWAGTEPVSGLALADDPSTRTVSIVGGEDLTRELGIRIRFCREAECTGLGDDRAPEARFLVERAFYLGHRTRLRLEIPEVPSAPPSPTTIARCRVEGCLAGTTSTYCSLDGRHFCDQ